MTYFPDNTLTRYTTRLPQMMDLDGSWEIGLAEIQYPHTWYNIKQGEGWVAVHYNKDDTVQQTILELPEGYYSSAKRVCKGIEIQRNRADLRKQFAIGLNEVNHKVFVQVKGDNSQVILSPLLQTMLGFKQAIFQGGEHHADYVADITRGLSSMYVYCPLVEPRMVGDAQVPLVRIVPIEGRDGDMMTRVFDPIQYCTLAQRRFQDIAIDIRDDTGEPVPFERGRVVVTLHCRKKKTYLE